MKIIVAIITVLLFCNKGIAQEVMPKEKQLPAAVQKESDKAKNIFFEKNESKQPAAEAARNKEILIKENADQQLPVLQDNMQAEQFQKDQKVSQVFAQKAIIISNEEMGNAAMVKALIRAPKFEDDAEMKRLVGPSQFDSRIEIRLLDPLVDWEESILQNAHSVGLIVSRENLTQVSATQWRLGTGIKLGEKYKLCPGQAFAAQPVAGEGTGFVVSNNQVITAAHVFTGPVSNYVLVFGFEMINKTGAYEATVQQENIYSLKQIQASDDALDIVVVETDSLLNKAPLRLSKKPLAVDDEVYMIGYPSGLPEKVSLNAGVTATDNLQYFYTSLDAFQGNSGSPVFSFATHEVIGVLVSGEVDYIWNGNCNVTTLCRIPYCKGEKAIRITEVVKLKDQE